MTLEPAAVREMFDRISPAYDRMNRIMSLGLDARWRERAAALTAARPGDAVVDVCCGTGDLALAVRRRVGPSGRVVGVDFSERMLAAARSKDPTMEWLVGDALDLPFGAAEFAAATCGFGVRNLPDARAGFAEMRRVVAPGGRVVCLELTEPPAPLRPVSRAWTDRAVPLLGRLVARDGAAYTYLPASVHRFPPARELAAVMRRAGLVDVRYVRPFPGAVAIHVGTVPA